MCAIIILATHMRNSQMQSLFYCPVFENEMHILILDEWDSQWNITNIIVVSGTIFISTLNQFWNRILLSCTVNRI